MDSGLGAYFGWLLSQPEGYSIAACGFVHSSTIEKFNFTSDLSFRSTCKKLLSRMSYLFVLHYATLVLSIFSSTSVTSKVKDGIRNYKAVRYKHGSLTCLIYGQNGDIFDRGFPNLDIGMGVAEYFYGTSLGALRSENPDLLNTVHYQSPQLTDTCLDGAILNGQGFVTNISTTCDCPQEINNNTLTTYDANSTIVQELLTELHKLDITSIGMAISIERINNNSIIITHINTGTHVCGNFGQGERRYPICKTTLSDHLNADIEME